MSRSDSPSRDYYDILGADENISPQDLERLYKRMAALHHPDKGGSEEAMKDVNEAYGVLKDEISRREYNAKRRRATLAYAPVYRPPARDVGTFGNFLSAFLCLLMGLFLLMLVRFQWFWFLWPLAILALFVILFGVFMARSAVHNYRATLPATNPLHRYGALQEALFWTLVLTGGVGVYVLLTAVE